MQRAREAARGVFPRARLPHLDGRRRYEEVVHLVLEDTCSQHTLSQASAPKSINLI